MQTPRRFKPALDTLESKVSLSSATHRHPVHHPVKHQAAHVRPHVVQAPPHQVSIPRHTGTLISGALTNALQESPIGSVVTFRGYGPLNVGRTSYNCGFCLRIDADTQLGVMSLTTDSGTITGTVTSLANLKAGNYQFGSGDTSGKFDGLAGTGIIILTQADDGSYSIAFNPHQ